MKKYIVYKIENIVNNKVYIGYTSLSINKRFHKHYTNALYGIKSKLYNSIRKNGIVNFNLCELYSTIELSDALNMERFYINKYDSFKNGYNMTLGGDGGNCTLYMDESKMLEYKSKLIACNYGESNNNYSGFNDDEIVQYGVRCYLDNNNWIQSYWLKNYCEKYNLPKSYSKFRFNGEGLRGLKKRILFRLNEMGIDLESLKYIKTDIHKSNLSKLYKGKKWYHNNNLKINKQLSETEVDNNWELGRKNFKKIC